MKKKKTTNINTATAADPKADRMPIKIPLPVEPAELPPALTRRPLSGCDIDSRMLCIFDETRSGDAVAASAVSVGELDGDGEVTTEVRRVEGREERAPGPDASEWRMVHE